MPISREYTPVPPNSWLCIEYMDPAHEEITRYMVYTDPAIFMPDNLDDLKVKLNSYLNNNYEAKNTNIQAHIASPHAPVIPGGAVGYLTGSGGTIVQTGTRTGTVILNKLCGNITMVSAAQAINAQVNFTLTNSNISSTDYLLVQHISSTNGGAWGISTICSNGSAVISIRNNTTASITEATPLRFFVLKAVIT